VIAPAHSGKKTQNTICYRWASRQSVQLNSLPTWEPRFPFHEGEDTWQAVTGWSMTRSEMRMRLVCLSEHEHGEEVPSLAIYI